MKTEILKNYVGKEIWISWGFSDAYVARVLAVGPERAVATMLGGPLAGKQQTISDLNFIAEVVK